MNENVLSYQIIQVQFNKKGSLSQALRAKIPQKSYSLHKAILLTKSPVFSLRQSKKISSKEHFIVKREIKTIFKMDRILDHIFRWYCCPVLECCWSLCKPCCRFFWKGFCWCCWCCGCCTGKELNCYEILCECLEEGVIHNQQGMEVVVQVPLSIISATQLMSPAIMAMEAVMDAVVVVMALMESAAKFFAKFEFEVHLRPNFEFRVNAVYLTVTRLLKFCSGKVFKEFRIACSSYFANATLIDLFSL